MDTIAVIWETLKNLDEDIEDLWNEEIRVSTILTRFDM
ncbi:MAG: hypothetical protein PWP39_1419 [Pyrococcus sp.]|nr:hypothetical protein [Pyrococcus sp.]